ncbi:MAG: hypothetical protein CMP73_01485 [Flavobacteriales bacterium]|nr:hypothetical protein [Flavobacteriales bacterium]
MLMNKIITIFILMLITLSNYAQINFKRDTTLKVKESGIYYMSPFDGGINSAQFSEIDLDLDGTMDIIIFDKSGNKIMPYVKQNGEYIYAPNYRNNFPDIHDWMLLADFNCDGKNDIFTYSSGGMAIYKNTSVNSLNFNLITLLTLSDFGSWTGNIYISSVDIPAIADIDYDGDLDILTFSITGGFVEYHKNMAVERTGTCDTILSDSLAFKLSESCWGLFYEGLNSYVLNCPNCQCPPISNPTSNMKQKHAGSTLLAIDVDNDNDKDLILGDVSYNNLNLLINNGDNQNAIITNVDSLFPKNNNTTIAVNIDAYPASYYLDVTNDGVKDLIVTTNSQNNSENLQSCWLYENNQQNTNPDFNFVDNDFIQNRMIDLGSGSYPVFYDYNNDSLIDIVIGNYGYHSPNNDPISSLALLKNIGTNSTPEYELLDRDWLSISNIPLNTNLNIPALNIAPTFGDLNGDNKKDLIIGDADGNLHLFINSGGGNFQAPIANYQNIDIGNFAQPQIIDVNRDGLNDLLIGEQDGTINYCPNSGSASSAIFDTIIENFGSIDVDQAFISTGFSSPQMIDVNGLYNLYVGSYSGTIYHYTNIDNNLNGAFTAINSNASSLWDGGKCSFSMYDITNDNQLDMILGNISGGIAFFNGDTSTIIEPSWNCTNNICIDPGDGSGFYNTLNLCEINCNANIIFTEEKQKVTIFPNPTDNIIFIQVDNKKSDKFHVIIYNQTGQVVYNKLHEINQDKIEINTSILKKGMYNMKVYNNKTNFMSKIAVK